MRERIDGGVAEGADAFFLFALVTCHPGANEKLAPGAAKIGFDVNQEYPDTKSFFVERTDGSRAGFSARKCVDELYPKDSTKSALTLGRQSMGAREYKESPQKKARDPPPRGAHVRIDRLTGQAIQYGEIKDALSEYAVPRFVDLNDDEGYAIARFDDNESAVKACACVEIEGAAVTVVVMEPELEDAYRKDADAKREAAREAKRLLGVVSMGAALAAALGDDELRVVRLRYGLDDGIVRSTRDCAQVLGVGRETVRQTCLRAFRRLRGTHAGEALLDYVD